MFTGLKHNKYKLEQLMFFELHVDVDRSQWPVADDSPEKSKHL